MEKETRHKSGKNRTRHNAHTGNRTARLPDKHGKDMKH